MSRNLHISVVTPTFNSEKTLRETLESVRMQDYSHCEHWVIDGGSTDRTLDIVKEFPHVQWISEKDEGHYHAMNKGIERSTGGVVVILNADDCYMQGAFRKVAAALEAHPDWEGVFGDVIYVDGEGRELYRRKEAKFDYQVLRFAFDYICHHSMFVRRDVYQRLGVYRHKEFKNCCDYDFMLRMAKAGCRIGKINDFIIRYRYHGFGQGLDRRIIENTDRESAILKREHGCPGGFLGKAFYAYGHARRQAQKILYRRSCDLVPARWILRKHIQEKTTFSSNIDLDKL